MTPRSGSGEKKSLSDLQSDNKNKRARAAKILGGNTEASVIEALVEALADDFWIVRKAAADSLVETGEAAIEQLLDALENGNEDTGYWTSRILGKIDQNNLIERLISLLDHSRSEVERYASRSLLEKGEAAVDELIEALIGGTRDQRFWSAQTLGEIGSHTAVTSLIKTLYDEDWAIRREAVKALGEIGAPEAVDELRSAIVREEAWSVRVEIARSLGKIRDCLSGGPEHAIGDWITTHKPVDAKVIDSLVSSMVCDETDINMKLTTIQVLGEIGGERAIEILLKSLADPRGEIRAQAARALGQTSDRMIVAALGRAAQDSYLQVRKNAVEALGKIRSRRAVDILIEAVSDLEPEVRTLAAKSLGAQRSPEAIDVLLRALEDESEEVRYWATDGLGKLGSRRTLGALLELLHDPSGAVRECAITALGLLGDNACVEPLLERLPQLSSRELIAALSTLSRLAGPELVFTLKDLLQAETHREKRYSIIEALGRIGTPKGDKALFQIASGDVQDEKIWAVDALRRSMSFQDLDSLTALLSKAKSEFRLAVLKTLSEIPGNLSSTPLIPVLKSRDHEARRLATVLLGRTREKPVYKTLIKLLSDRDREVRFAAVRALDSLNDTAALPSLISCFKDTYWPVRKAAAGSAGKLEPPPRKLLIQALDSANHDTVFWAVKALGIAGEETAVNALSILFESAGLAAKRNIIESLGKIGTPEAVTTLLTFLRNSDYSIRLAAVKSLKDISDPRAEESLLTILEQEEGDIRYWAARALGRSGTDKSVSILKMFTNSDNFWLRKYARTSINMIEAQGRNSAESKKEKLN
ncbi:MAG: HEAT repeat domain-containing protein [bacterium]|nr:HEAT repeat domain-containing protein [bacterium]